MKRVPVSVDANGYLVRLEDIATITRSQVTPPSSLAFINGKPAVLISARMQGDIRVDAWTESANDLLDSFRTELPDNIQLNPIFQQAGYTEVRLSDLSIVCCSALGWFLRFCLSR